MLWTKILISIIAIGISIVEVWEFRKKKKKKNWEKIKKPVIVIGSLLLLLLTVWDEVADENQARAEEERSNKQIIADSLRISKIILNLNDANTKIDSSTKNLVRVDSSIGFVKNVLNEQVGSLTNIVSESKEIQKNLTGGDSYLKYFLIKRYRNQVLELHCAVIGKYPMQNVNSYITCSSFQDSLLKKPISLEPLIIGKGMNRAFEIDFSSLTSYNPTYLIAKFDVSNFKGDIILPIWTRSNNGSTFQLITWKNHRKYLSGPPRTNKTTLKGKENTDWSGGSFEYSSRISRVEPMDIEGLKNNELDNTAGIYYDETQSLYFNLYYTMLMQN